MSGLSDAGFERKRLVDIKSDLEDALKLVFGDNIDLQSQSGFGQVIGILSEALSDQWQELENVYNSQYPSTASGAGLSNTVKLNGLTRLSAEYSTVVGTISGIEGKVIAAGSIAKTSDTDESFTTDSDVTIPASGSIDADFTCIRTGSVAAGAGTLTVIGSPVYGWTSVTNAASAELGRDEETDAELRDRQDETTLSAGQNNADSLYGQLINLSGVLDALVMENKTDTTDSNGIPPHQFECIVQSGDSTDIVDTIWSNTPQGINSYGTSSEVVEDSQGFDQTVYYTRPAEVEYYVLMNLTVDSLNFPTGGDEDIKTAVVEYSDDNFKISDDVVYSQLYTPINETKGVIGIELFIGTSSSPTGTTNITIDIDEISVLTETRVEVNIV